MAAIKNPRKEKVEQYSSLIILDYITLDGNELEDMVKKRLNDFYEEVKNE